MKHCFWKALGVAILLSLLLTLTVLSCALSETYTITYYDYDGNLIEGFPSWAYWYYAAPGIGKSLPGNGDTYPDLLPELDGKIFVGWCMQPDRSDDFINSIQKTTDMSRDLTFYAYYAEYYTVTWYSPDGKVLTEDDMKWKGSCFDKYTSKKAYGCPTPNAPEGKKFIGWSATPNNEDNLITTIKKGTTGSLSFYAVYRTLYSITYYDGDTKIENFDSQYYNYEEGGGRDLPTAKTYPEILPERDGEIFVGWCEDNGLTGKAWTYISYSDGWNRDAVLYACYSKAYSVTWYSMDGTALTEDDMISNMNFFSKYTSRKWYTCPTPKVPDGMKFAGWSKSPTDKKNTIYDIEKGTEGDLSLYAIFKPANSITYYNGTTIIEGFDSFYYSYAEGTGKALPFAYDYPDLLPEQGEKIFVGWCKRSDLSGKIYEILDDSFSGDIKLYACYAKGYPVTWYAPDGTILTVDDMGYWRQYFDKYSSKIEYWCPTPKVPEGKAFLGWYKSADYAGEPIQIIEKGTKGELNLYARYISIEDIIAKPSSWTLNSDSTKTSGHFVLRIEGQDASFITLGFVDETTFTKEIEDNKYYVWFKNRESNSTVIGTVIGNRAWFDIPITFRDMPNIITLPSATKIIKAEAFMNCTNIDGVSIDGNQLVEIQSCAFKNCTGLYFIEIPDSVTTIAEDAFENCPNVQFYCNDGSVAAKYAEAHGIQYSPKYYMEIK